MQGKIKVYAGGGRTGKSTAMYNEIIDKAIENPDKNYYLIVPEQVTSILERKFIALMKERHGSAGFFNISILGFNRLAHLIFEEAGHTEKMPLEEYGKSMLVRYALGKLKEELKVYKGSIERRGFIDNMKSIISEMLLFDISPEDLEKVLSDLNKEDAIYNKLSDIILVYKEFLSAEKNSRYSIPEETLSIFADILNEEKIFDRKNIIRDAVFYFDHFTGYTAVQMNVLQAVKKWAESMTFAITIDAAILRNNRTVKEYELYYESYDMYLTLIDRLGEADIRFFDVDKTKEDHELRAMADKIFRFPVKPYEKENGRVLISKCSTPLEELRVAAEMIRKEVIENNKRYRDFAIINGQLEELSPICEEVLRDYDIPFFSDYKRKFSSNPYTESIRELLLILDKDYSYDGVFSFFKTGVMDRYLEKKNLDPELIECYENTVIAHGIRGKRLYGKKVTAFLGKREVATEVLEQLEEEDKVRQAFLEVMEPLHKAVKKKKKVNVREFTEAIRFVIGPEMLDFSSCVTEAEETLRELERPAEEMAYHAIPGVIDEILLKLEDILGDEEMTIHEYEEILGTGIDNLAIGVIPPVQDAVIVGDPERTRLIDVDTVFFINMVDGVVPPKAAPDGLITDRDRVKIDEAFSKANMKKKMAPGETLKSYIEYFTLYLIFEKAKNKLVLSYAESDMSGSDKEKSFILGRIEKLLPSVKEVKRKRTEFCGTKKTDIFDYTKTYREVVESLSLEFKDLDLPKLKKLMEKDNEYKNNNLVKLGIYKNLLGEDELRCNIGDAAFFLNRPDAISQDILKDLDIKISVSKLEKYAQCPYLYYLTYILGLKERRGHDTDQLDLGNIIHSVLEKAFKRVNAEYNGDFNLVSEEQLKEITDLSVIEAVTENKEELLRGDEKTGKDIFVLENIKKIARDTMDTLSFQMKQGKMKPQFVETGFKAEFTAKNPDGTKVPVEIKGKIDRGDIFAKDNDIYVRIIDYKTGNKKLELKKILSGESIQLSVYLGIILRLIKKKYEESGENVIPSGFYYYHISNLNADAKDLKGIDPEAEEFIEKTRESALKQQALRGLPNIDADKEGDEKYRSLMIQEERMADAKSADGMVLPIKIKEDKITGKYASAEDLKAVTEFSLQKMEETTAKVLTGNIDKSPLCDSKTGSGWACEWCKAREVCRFMDGSGDPRVRAKEDDSLKKIIEKGREINSSLSNPIFLSKEEEAKFIDNIENDLDIEDEE